jgi:hypothetical protein
MHALDLQVAVVVSGSTGSEAIACGRRRQSRHR